MLTTTKEYRNQSVIARSDKWSRIWSSNIVKNLQNPARRLLESCYRTLQFNFPIHRHLSLLIYLLLYVQRIRIYFSVMDRDPESIKHEKIRSIMYKIFYMFWNFNYALCIQPSWRIKHVIIQTISGIRLTLNEPYVWNLLYWLCNSACMCTWGSRLGGLLDNSRGNISSTTHRWIKILLNRL